ncbi:MAG: hypothetical protein AAF633_10295, partial [Chloroflexota bacterium]
IMMWERADIAALPEELPRKEIPYWQRAMFGIIPMGFLAAALFVSTLFWWGRYLENALETTGIYPFMRWAVAPIIKNFMRLWNWIDKWLIKWSALREEGTGEEAWWHIWVYRAQNMALPMEVAPSAKLVRSLMLLLIVFLVGVQIYVSYQNVVRDPIKQVEGYYDDLDFRRFQDAWERLDPDLRKPYDLWLLDMTSVGGMLASYAKLDNIKARIIEEEDNRLLVEVDLDWVSSLLEYNSSQQLELVLKEDGFWYIKPLPVDTRATPDSFFRQGAVAWQVQTGVRTDETITSFDNFSDRPELQIISSRLVLNDGRYYVVGELMNLDVDPADLTVSAYLFDNDNEVITWYNAQKVISHKIFPKEITPFRVDFEGVAGFRVTDRDKVGDFRPDDYTPIDLEEPINYYEVYAKAVVTPYDLNRSVGIQNLHMEVEEIEERTFDYVNFEEEVDDTLEGRIPVYFYVDNRDAGKQRGVLKGSLINNGTIEAIIPQLLITYYNEAGEVLWVDAEYLPESIKPQKEFAFEVPLTPLENVRTIDSRGANYSNVLDAGIQEDFSEGFPWMEKIEAPPGLGYDHIRVSVNYFIASP